MSNFDDQYRMSVRLPVYMKRETKDILDELKFYIKMSSGHTVSLSKLMRQAILHLIDDHKEDILQYYENNRK